MKHPQLFPGVAFIAVLRTAAPISLHPSGLLVREGRDGARGQIWPPDSVEKIHSALVRKILVRLARDGSVIAHMGKNGGVRLGRPPEEITLRDVYVSVVEQKKLFTTRPNVPAVCVVSTNIDTFFQGLADDAEAAMLGALGKRTVAQSLSAIRELDMGRGRRDPLPGSRA